MLCDCDPSSGCMLGEAAGRGLALTSDDPLNKGAEHPGSHPAHKRGAFSSGTSGHPKPKAAQLDVFASVLFRLWMRVRLVARSTAHAWRGPRGDGLLGMSGESASEPVGARLRRSAHGFASSAIALFVLSSDPPMTSSGARRPGAIARGRFGLLRGLGRCYRRSALR